MLSTARRSRLIMLAVALVSLLVLAGCGGGDEKKADTPAELSASVQTDPPANAVDVSPIAPVSATVTDGTFETVALTNANGKAVQGQLTPDSRSWTTTEPLGYDRTYTWSGTVVGADGLRAPVVGSFTTLSPASQIAARTNVGDGSTYGIGMPIALTFDDDVTDKASVERALQVTTSQPVEGAWAWLDDRTVHWRPNGYWPSNTQVNVSAKLYGVSFGGGAYGKADLTSDFTIGRSYVLKGDTRTHRLLAFADGQQVADYPASYGLDSDPGRVTRSGTHLVMEKHETYFMNNPRYDYQNVEAKYAVRISNNGEFTHSAPWSVGQQGSTNVSHGCINLAPASAQAVFDAVLPGDPVEITGSTVQLTAADGDYYDWTIPWEEWLAKSALR